MSLGRGTGGEGEEKGGGKRKQVALIDLCLYDFLKNYVVICIESNRIEI